ncbi:hypothetical protein V8E36_007596 [Tilletia maclaganii]
MERDIRREAIRAVHAVGRTRDRTAGQFAALGQAAYDQALGAGSSSRGSQTFLPSGRVYTGALAPGNSAGSGLFLATAPPSASAQSTYIGASTYGAAQPLGPGTFRAPDNMRTQKQAAKEKRAKVKKKKVAQAQAAASALAGRPENSLLGPASAPTGTGTGSSSGRVSPAVRSSADERENRSRPGPRRASSATSDRDGTDSSLAASTGLQTSQRRPATPSMMRHASSEQLATMVSTTSVPATASVPTLGATRHRRRPTAGRASAADSELASRAESRPYNLYREMLGASSDEDEPVAEGSTRRLAPPPHAPTVNAGQLSSVDEGQAPLAVPTPPSAHIDVDLAAATSPEDVQIPPYPPPPFPVGPSTRPRTPPTPPPPLRPPDPTMTEEQQREERELERAWEAYRSKWEVPSSPPPAFESDNEEDGRSWGAPETFAQFQAQPASSGGPVLGDHSGTDGGPENGEEGTDSGSDAASVTSSRRAWEDDMRSGLGWEERVAREASRRVAKIPPAERLSGARDGTATPPTADLSIAGDIVEEQTNHDRGAGPSGEAEESGRSGNDAHALQRSEEGGGGVGEPNFEDQASQVPIRPGVAGGEIPARAGELSRSSQPTQAGVSKASRPKGPELQGAFSIDAGALLQEKLQGPLPASAAARTPLIMTAHQAPTEAKGESDQVQLRRLPTVNARRIAALDAIHRRSQNPVTIDPEPAVAIADAISRQEAKTEPEASSLRRLPTVNSKRLAALEQRSKAGPVIAAAPPRKTNAGSSQSVAQTESTQASAKVAAPRMPSVAHVSDGVAPSTRRVLPVAGDGMQGRVPSDKYHRDAFIAAERRRQLWQGTDKPSAAARPADTLVQAKAPPRTSIEAHDQHSSADQGATSGRSTPSTKNDNGSRTGRSASASDYVPMASETSPTEDTHQAVEAESESSDEQWEAEDEAWKRIEAKNEAVLRMRQRADREYDSSGDEEQPPVPFGSPMQQQLQALASLDRRVPRAPPPLALGRSRNGAAFSSSEESSDEERRLESTGSEPEDEDEDDLHLRRRSSDVSERSVRSVDTSALAAFNYLRARTRQLTGYEPDDSLEVAQGGPAQALPDMRRRLPPLPPTMSSSPSKAHFVQNEADDDAIAAHAFSQFSSAQKGKAPVRPVDHLVFTSPVASNAPTATSAQRADPLSGPARRPLPVPPRQVHMQAQPFSPPSVSSVGIDPLPLLPPRPSTLDAPPSQVREAIDERHSVGTRLKGLFGAQLEGNGSKAELMQTETVSKIRQLFDQPVAERDKNGVAQPHSVPQHQLAIPAKPEQNFTAPTPAAVQFRAPTGPPAPPIKRGGDVGEKEAQMQAISIARTDSLRALEERLRGQSGKSEKEPAPVELQSPCGEVPSPSSLGQPAFSEDRALHSVPGLSRSGAISGRNGPPPPAFFTRRFGPRPSSFVNPRSGDAPRPLGRLPTITPATRHYQPTKRIVPSDTASAAGTEGSAVSETAQSMSPRVAAAPDNVTPTVAPSWLAQIPSEERTRLPAPIAPIMLHDGPVGDIPIEVPAVSPASNQPRPQSMPVVVQARLEALQRRPPPPPPPGRAVGQARSPAQFSASPAPVRPSPTSSSPQPTPTIAAGQAGTARTGVTQARPLPTIPLQTASASSAHVPALSAGSDAPEDNISRTEPAGATEGEALEERPRSALRPPRREPSLGITDLDLLVSELERNGDHYEDLTAISEFLGPARSTKPSAAELAALSVGHVELERRRVNAEGRVKQKLSVAGVRVDRCGICLTQFRVGEECCIYPCWHIYHRKCAATVLLTSRVCPTCRKDIATAD